MTFTAIYKWGWNIAQEGRLGQLGGDSNSCIRLAPEKLKIHTACPGSGCQLNVYTAAPRIIIIVKPRCYNVILRMPEHNQVLPVVGEPSSSSSSSSSPAPWLLRRPDGRDRMEQDSGWMKCDELQSLGVTWAVWRPGLRIAQVWPSTAGKRSTRQPD